MLDVGPAMGRQAPHLGAPGMAAGMRMRLPVRWTNSKAIPRGVVVAHLVVSGAGLVHTAPCLNGSADKGSRRQG